MNIIINLKRIGELLTQPSPKIEDEDSKTRARILSFIFLLISIIHISLTFTNLIILKRVGLEVLFISIPFNIIELFSYFLSRTKYYSICGIFLVVLSFLISIYSLFIDSSFFYSMFPLFTTFLILVSVLIFDRKTTTIISIVTFFIFLIIISLTPELNWSYPILIAYLIVIILIISLNSYIMNSRFEIIKKQRRVENEIYKKQKIESLGLLAGGIAHDFNNILTTILGNLSLMELDLKKKEQLEILNNVEDCKIGAIKARDLAQQLLTFSKGGEPQKSIIDIQKTIIESANFALHGSNINIIYNFSSDLWMTNIDKGQISQVIQNLVINSSQAMPNGGKIIISAKNENISQENPYHLKKGSYIIVTVDDEGSGIPEHIKSKIFDIFFTTKSIGTGLGLAISQSIIARHNGYIFIEEKRGLGAKFAFYLPAIENKISSTNENTSKEELINKSSCFLILDDELTVSKILKSMLKQLNIDSVETHDGEDTIRIYKESLIIGKKFDVVILDLTIRNGMGGIETMKELIQIDKNVKVIISSGYIKGEIMKNFKKYGFIARLDKPYFINELSDVIKEVMNSETGLSKDLY
ncbi:MAG: response regulator [archaeon]|nr:response regulator [archaeon]